MAAATSGIDVNRNRLLLAVLCVVIAIACNGETELKQKDVRFRLSKDVEVRSMSSCPTTGDLAVVGSARTWESEDREFFAARISSKNMKVVWQKVHGTSEEDMFSSVLCDASGIVHAVGYTRGSFGEARQHTDKDLAFVQYSTDGAIKYQESSGAKAADDVATSITQSRRTGHLLIAGASHGRYWRGQPGFLLLEYDHAGNYNPLIPELMGLNLGGFMSNSSTYVEGRSFDGATYILGSSDEGREGALLFRVVEGNTQWSVPLRAQDVEISASDIVVDHNSLPVVLTTRIRDGHTTTWLTKFSTSGVKLWDRSLGPGTSLSDGLFFADNHRFYVHLLDGSTKETLLEVDAGGNRRGNAFTVPDPEGQLVERRGFTMDRVQSRMVLYRSKSEAYVSVISSDIDGYEPYTPEPYPNVKVEFSLRVRALDGELTDQKRVSLLDFMIDKWQTSREHNISTTWEKRGSHDLMSVTILTNSHVRELYPERVKHLVSSKRVHSLLKMQLQVSHAVVDNCMITFGCNGTAIPVPEEAEIVQASPDGNLYSDWHIVVLGIVCGILLASGLSTMAIVLVRKQWYSSPMTDQTDSALRRRPSKADIFDRLLVDTMASNEENSPPLSPIEQFRESLLARKLSCESESHAFDC